MKRLIVAFAAAIVFWLPVMPSANAFAAATASATHAIGWLHQQQGPDGGIGGDVSRTEEVIWGLVANQKPVDSFVNQGKSPLDYLTTHHSAEKTAGKLANLVMAVSAAGKQATSFAGRNLLIDLSCTYNSSTGEYGDQLYSHALALIAIPTGGVAAKAIQFLKTHQNTDGGWGFNLATESDTNSTAVAMMALAATHALDSADTKARALAYLKLQQLPASGGFKYQTASFVTDSDPDSDGLVIQGLLAAGEDPTGTAWTVSGKNALTDLISFQLENGGFSFNRSTPDHPAQADLFSTSQPLIALASAHLPIKPTSGVMPSTCPTTAASPTPTPTPAPTPNPAPPQLAQTGQPVLGSFALFTAGVLALLAGLHRRRRR